MYDISDTWRTCIIKCDAHEDLDAVKAALAADLAVRYKQLKADLNRVVDCQLALKTDSLDIVPCSPIE